MQLCQKPLSRCFEFLALFLFVLPWFCCKAFQPPLKVGDLKPNRLRLLLASLPSLEEDKMSTVIPNWRVIPANADDHGTHLIGRETWSEEQFSASLALYDRFMQCSDSFIEPGIKAALDTLDHAYRLYGPESVICSFNGGKDAIVILHLLRAAHAKYYNSTSGGKVPIRPRVIYFDHEDEFPEVTSFLKDSVNTHDLDMVAFEKGIKFANGLEILVQNNVLPGCNTTFPMAFVLGTRSSDPNAKGQDHFAPSSDWMPPFMRVNPVLHWNYGHVWHFLRLFQLPYCSLYDEGYTSLGTTKDTLPCPALAVNAGEENGISSALPKFWPAYMLRDWDQERAGRIKKGKKQEPSKTERQIPQTTSASTLSTNSDSVTLTPIDTAAENPSEQGSSGRIDDESTVFTLDAENSEQKSVAVLIIGDEILKGMTIDQNTVAAAKALRNECVKLAKVIVVSDDQDEIVKVIQQLQKEVDVIITSGGVGPTHDDITIKSVAASLDRPMVFHEEMAELLKAKMNNGVNPLTPAQNKMAMLPSNSKLRYLSEDEDDWPVLQVRNIFVLPGVPEFFSRKIENVAAYLSSQLERSAAYKVILSVDEQAIVGVLNNAVTKHPNVNFGSYPFVSHPEYKTVLTLEGSLLSESTGRKRRQNSVLFGQTALFTPKVDRDRYVRKALDDLITQLPYGSILRVENDDLTPFT